MFLAVHLTESERDYVRVYRSTDNGANWASLPILECSDARQPCIAAYGSVVAVAWVSNLGRIMCSWSIEDGVDDSWTTGTALYRMGDYEAPSVSVFGLGQPFEGQHVVSIAAELTTEYEVVVSTTFGRIDTSGSMKWGRAEHWLSSGFGWWGPAVDFFANPCIGTRLGGNQAHALCVFVDDGLFAGGDECYDLYGRYAAWLPLEVAMPPAHTDGTGRRIQVIEGTSFYSARVGANIHSGVAREDGILEPGLLSCGTANALATDAGGSIWSSFLRDDSVWCRTGNGCFKVACAGTSSVVPGQPSIVCYPNQANGMYVGGVTFACYDTVQGTSMLLWARVDTGGVVLDTIESVANLKDSLPCINVYGDTLLVTWQHGTDSVLSSMLADYGPGTTGRPPAWSSPSLVTASGYHPMSVMENGSDVLSCVWSQKSGSDYSIQRSTNDLGGGMFSGWVAQTPPSAASAVEKANGVYTGSSGCSVWQEKNLSDKWVIKAFVRGAETTLVDNDTDAYHPHSVAESSGSNPSTDLIRLHLLYDAGVAIEVDSGQFDTGEVRYSVFDFPVSHAGANATRANGGTKLVRKAGTDSLMCVYADADGSVVYAWSATGDSWQREIMATGREYPAIAEDSSGKRWVVMRKPGVGMLPPVQEAYYRNGSSWTGPQNLYAVSGTTLRPASLSGSSYTESGIAYAAFIATATGGTQSLILAKFDGTNVSTCTVTTGTALGDPALTVEPYKADSDHIHVTWVDDGTLKYAMDTDGRSTSIASTWTSPYSLTARGVVAAHPSINSDAGQIVVAWAQGSPTDVYARKRLTSSTYDNWNTAVNLSNTSQDGSDYPTVAMGDTIVVAWQETRGGGNDQDILASIDFGDTVNIADNATFSGYPHVLFYNKTSGDTTIPYVLTIASETPEASYYEVSFNKLNLKEASGEGQQSASLTPIPASPMLEACRPNPFRGHTQINYALPATCNVSLRVYDVTGRTVRTLASGHQKAGLYSVSWDSRDSHGQQVPYGVYFYRLDTPGFRSVKKAVVAR